LDLDRRIGRSRKGKAIFQALERKAPALFLRAIGDQITSPGTFFRLPWVSWKGPRALKTDMKGPALMALFADVATGNSGETAVLEATCCRGSNLFVSEGAKEDAVRKLVEG
jgi:hypothetical protein